MFTEEQIFIIYCFIFTKIFSFKRLSFENLTFEYSSVHSLCFTGPILQILKFCLHYMYRQLTNKKKKREGLIISRFSFESYIARKRCGYDKQNFVEKLYYIYVYSLTNNKIKNIFLNGMVISHKIVKLNLC